MTEKPDGPRIDSAFVEHMVRAAADEVLRQKSPEELFALLAGIAGELAYRDLPQTIDDLRDLADILEQGLMRRTGRRN